MQSHRSHQPSSSLSTSRPILTHAIIKAKKSTKQPINKENCKNQLHLLKCNKEWRIEDFEILKQMGRGKFGQVFLAMQRETEYIVALKKMSKAQLQANDFSDQAKREIIIQSTLNHPHILKLFGYFWDSEFVYLILEYCPGGQLFEFLKSQGKLAQDKVSQILMQVCKGLQYLHGRDIIHRDIKPENILIGVNGIKIADFGWSIHAKKRRQTICGTLDYLSPEMVKGDSHDNAIDIWCVGILAFQLLVGHPPFQMPSYEATYCKILNEEVQFPNHISFEARVFIRKCLTKCPKKRLTIDQVMNQPFLQQKTIQSNRQ